MAQGAELGQALALAEDAWLAAEFPLDRPSLETIADQAAARFNREPKS